MENQTTIFVQNFDTRVSAEELYGLFQESSERKSLISTDVYRNPLQHRRVAMMKFGDPRDAHESSLALEGFPLDFSEIKISHYFPEELSRYNHWEHEEHLSNPKNALIQRQRNDNESRYNHWEHGEHLSDPKNAPIQRQRNDNEVTEIHVANLSLSTSEESLKSVFDQYGLVTETRVIKDVTGTSKGYGFVKFQSTESASAAITDLSGHVLDGKTLRVQKAYKEFQRHQEIGEAMSKGLVVYVENLHYGVNEAHLEQVFSQFGDVVTCRIRRNKVTGVSKGDAFMEFATKEQVVRAMSMDGKKLWGRAMYLAAGKSKV